ncbi:hypothetical protein CWD94_12915 [Lysinibacillus xylanilyticus]|uniref:Uncharacterized protein n=1 Tax=Lysinibacillus xylanilyticus TaxID=582475 RepID=A0A2M9Q5K3_9BACI|nr:hypothetical protein CWD94_12915 [Lysinibacillus xylanilyticus]
MGDSLGISVTDVTLEEQQRNEGSSDAPQEALLCAKAQRQQQQSAHSERKSTSRFAEELWRIQKISGR